ncbi:MAG: hypothetical protein QM741_16795 [Rudaea sp.]|uniref:hypothetical protein n=1 Tax=Rudaea sp. TaxID=2136325 RepID=UPI0039E55092
MRPFLHVVGVLCLPPGVLLASAFPAMGHTIAAGTLFGFFEQLLVMASWLIPWGVLGSLAIFLALLSAGFWLRLRWLAGLCVAVFAIGSAAVILAFGSQPISPDQLPFFLPALLSASIGLWLAFTEHPRGKTIRPTHNPESSSSISPSHDCPPF